MLILNSDHVRSVAAAPGSRFVGQILLYNAEDIRLLAVLFKPVLEA